MIIEILGPGCANCEKLEENVIKAIDELGIEATIKKVTDFNQVVCYGVMGTPALAVNGQVRAAGKVATVDEIKKYLQ